MPTSQPIRGTTAARLRQSQPPRPHRSLITRPVTLLCPILFALLSILLVSCFPKSTRSSLSFLHPLHSGKPSSRKPNNQSIKPPFPLPPRLRVHSAPLHRQTDPPDWRRPLVLAAHVSRARVGPPTSIRIALLTTGTDAGWFNRKLKLVGCAVDRQLYPAALVQPEMVVCRLPSSTALRVGARITALLRWDQHLRDAVNRPDFIEGVSFPILPGDIYRRFPDSASEQNPNTTNVKPPFLNDQPVAFVRSGIRWHPDMLEDPPPTVPRYQLCLMTQVKHDVHLVPDFLHFYRKMGVDQFYLYDNRATGDLVSFTSPSVQVVYWPWIRSQYQAYTHFLYSSKHRCKFTAFFDLDEYLFLGRDPSPDRNKTNLSSTGLLKTHMRIRHAQGFGQVMFPSLQMSSNGHAKRPHGPLPEQYTRAEVYQRGSGPKPVLLSSVPWTSHRINRAFGNLAETYYNQTIATPRRVDDHGYVVHFGSRSWEEFVKERREGISAVTQKYFPPAKLDARRPQAWYLTKEHSWNMFEFRDFWRTMSRTNPRHSMEMFWERDGQTCRRTYCPGCLFRKVGDMSCEKSAAPASKTS